MINWKNKIKMIGMAEIIPYKNNAKVHPESQVDKIARSIEAFGWDVPLVLDKDKVIVKGHGRYGSAGWCAGSITRHGQCGEASGPTGTPGATTEGLALAAEPAPAVAP